MNAPVSTAVSTIPQRASLVAKFAARYTIEPEKLLGVLKATAFKQGANDPEVTNEQMAALLVVADQYGLNPFTKEIYAFADRNKGVVPIVGLDGWSRIINDKPELDGIEFRYSTQPDPEWTECVIYRKDRSKPTVVREYLRECKRETGPWKSHPSRMLRHKALIQCARIAFGFAGIYDQDEAERIIEKDVTPAQSSTERSAEARLKAAVTQTPAEGADGLAHGYAEVSSVSGEDQQAEGTVEKRDEIIAEIKAAKSPSELENVLMKAGAYKWTKPDMSTINSEYHACLTVLG